MVKLENWSIWTPTSEPYQSPETGFAVLKGKAFGHPRFPEGRRVITSKIIGKRGNNILTFSGSEYVLGAVDVDYAKQYPSAKQELLDSLKEVVEDEEKEKGTDSNQS